MKYIIASTSVTDEIRFADGKTVERVAGGAGIYALCGLKLWEDAVLLTTGVGEDYEEAYGEWFKENGLSLQGIIEKDPKTPHTVIVYSEDGERIETPLYGVEHYRKIEITPEELSPYFKEAKGIYIFKNSDAAFWEKTKEAVKNSQTKVMWEIACDAAYPENKETVKEIAELVDIFSVNMTESKALLGKEHSEDVVKEYKTWKTPLIFLRRGAEGALMIAGGEIIAVPSEEGVKVVDPTGGGNSSSGAVLYGFTEGYPPEVCGRMGSISAAMCISQYGVPEKITDEMRQAAWGKIRRLDWQGEGNKRVDAKGAGDYVKR